MDHPPTNIYVWVDLMDLFKALRKYGLKISHHKCQFFKKKIVYMELEFQVKDSKVFYTPLKDIL